MSDLDEWGPWIEHDGKGMPDEVIGVDLECMVERNEDMPETKAEDCEEIASAPWLWAIIPCDYRVIRYRVRKPRALRDLIDLAANLPDVSPVGRRVEA